MLALLLASLALSATPKVVSPEWNAANVQKELAAFYADALAEALRQQGLQVITSQDIATLLGMERQKALVGCAEGNSCMAELANALGANATLTVNLARFDDGGFHGIAKLISSQSGQTLSSVTLDAKNERKLLEALRRAAPTLALGLGVKPAAAVTPEPETPGVTEAPSMRPPLTKWWWLFGLGGLVFGGASAGLFAYAAKQFDALTKMTSGDWTTADSYRTHGKSAQFTGWAAAGLGGALLVTGIVLAAWPSTPVVPQASVTAKGASVGVGGVF